MTYKSIAIKNLKYNMKRFVILFLVNSFVVAVLFMFGSLLFNKVINADAAASSVRSLIVMAAVGIAIFSVVFLVYTSIYFVKSRGREFGVYLTIGMTTRDLVRQIFVENAIVFGISALVGTLFGVILGRLFYIALGLVLGISENIYSIGLETFVFSLGILAFTFAITMFFVSNFIRRLSIVEITKSSSSKTAKEQKPIIGIIAAVVLAASIWLFHATVSGNYDFMKNYIREQPILSICLPIVGLLVSLFFFIGATMSSFKGILKKIPSLYNKNILLVSGLSHRFASYRTALFSVTLLIIFSVFFLGIGLSFYSYGDVTIDYFQPYDYMVEHRGDLNTINEEQINNLVERHGGQLSKISSLPYLDSQIYRELLNRDKLFVNVRNTNYLVSESNWNSHMSDTIQLSPEELLVIDNQQNSDNQDVDFNTIITIEPFKIGIERANDFRKTSANMEQFVKTLDEVQHLKYAKDQIKVVFNTAVNTYGNGDFAKSIICVIDDSIYNQLEVPQINELILFNLNKGDKKLIFDSLLKKLVEINKIDSLVWSNQNIQFGDINDISNLRPLWKQERMEILLKINGFLLFILAFLGLLFFISSCVVLLFKIISDIEDESIQIALLKKRGLTIKECRKYLQRQIAILFFLPVLIGGFLGMYLVNDMFSPFSAYSGVYMSRVAVMFGVIILIDIIMYFILRKIFFKNVKLDKN